MAARKAPPVARLLGLVVLIAGSVAVGFVFGMARPQPVMLTMTPPSDRTPTPAGGGAPDTEDGRPTS